MRERYNHKLEKLNSLMAEMCNLCRFAIENSVNALFAENNDESKKYRALVHDIDRDIDNSEGEIEKLCTNLIICEQPVASDLRTITVALKAVSDLERIGDQCSDIAELSGYISRCSINHKLHLKQMSECVIQMLDMAVSSFAESDLETARLVYAKDDEVDALFDKVKKEIVSIISKDDTDAELLVDLLMVSKYFERIGDHAENIAEWVEYSITGDFVNVM